MSYGSATVSGQSRRLRRALAIHIRRHPVLFVAVALSYIPIRLAVEILR